MNDGIVEINQHPLGFTLSLDTQWLDTVLLGSPFLMV